MGRDFVRNGELSEAFWGQKDVAAVGVCRRDAVGWGWAGLAHTNHSHIPLPTKGCAELPFPHKIQRADVRQGRGTS